MTTRSSHRLERELAHAEKSAHLALRRDRCTLRAMSAALCQGGSAGFPRRSILLWVALALACVVGPLAAPSAHADAMYRCTGSSGEVVFTSRTAGYRACHRVGSYVSRPRRTHVRRAKVVERARFDAVQSSVVTTAHALQAVPARSRAPRPMLFADVQTSVQTTARVLPTLPAGGGAAGRWTYRETPDKSGRGPAPAVGDRVLHGAVYRVVRADGSVEYTNLRPAKQHGHRVTMLFTYIATCMACDLHSPIHWGSVRLNLRDYADAIRSASAEYGVDQAFLRAIIHAESAFNPRAMSLKGAQGLMQLMPSTANDMGVNDAFDAAQNIRGGARYLAFLLKIFHGSERLAAAAYNAGPGAVQRYSGVPPYAETRVYVARVAELRKRYGRALHVPLAVGAAAASIR